MNPVVLRVSAMGGVIRRHPDFVYFAELVGLGFGMDMEFHFNC
jgi:hypothetical protein